MKVLKKSTSLMLLLLAFVILFIVGFSLYHYFYATKENFADSCSAPSRADMLNAPSPAVSAPPPPPPTDPNAPPQTCEEMATAAVTAGLMAGKSLDDVIKGAQANETARAAAAAAAASAGPAAGAGAGAGGSGAAGSAGVGVGGSAASYGDAGAGGSGGYGAGGSSSSSSQAGQNSGKKSCAVVCPSKK